MSQENVDRFLESVEAFNRGDVERWLESYHPDAVFEPQIAALEGSYSGHEGLRRLFADLTETTVMAEADYDDVRDLGDQVLALGTYRFIGEGSGIEIEFPWRWWRPSETASAPTPRTTAREPKPSKPPGCRNSCFGREAAIRFAWKAAV